MAEIVPAILAPTPSEFATQLDRVAPFARRVHIDVADGEFVVAKTIGLTQIYDVEGVPMDLHLMVADPMAEFETLVSLRPSLVIVHAEAKGDLVAAFGQLRQFGIKPGLALRPETSIAEVAELLPYIDHLLIFTGGNLGAQGGSFSAAGLTKIAQSQVINPKLEIAVDGGIDPASAKQASAAGAQVLDCGSYIQMAADPAAAYTELTKTLESS